MFTSFQSSVFGRWGGVGKYQIASLFDPVCAPCSKLSFIEKLRHSNARGSLRVDFIRHHSDGQQCGFDRIAGTVGNRRRAVNHLHGAWPFSWTDTLDIGAYASKNPGGLGAEPPFRHKKLPTNSDEEPLLLSVTSVKSVVFFFFGSPSLKFFAACEK